MRNWFWMLVLAFVLVSSRATAQVQVDWVHVAPTITGGPTPSARPGASALDASGTLYVAYDESQGAGDLLGLRRIDPDGSMAWVQLVPLPGASPISVAISPFDGGIYVAASGYSELLVVKYTASGQHVWTASLTGPVTGFGSVRLGRGLVFDANGAVYVGGRMHVGPHYALDFDGFVTSYDAAGALRFTTLVVGPMGRADDVFGILPDAATGGVRLVGTLDGDDDFSGRSSFSARVATSGVLSGLVPETAGPTSFVRIHDVEVDSASRLYVLRAFGASSTSWTSSTVSRLDANGALVDSVAYSSTVRRPYDVALAASGHVVVVGSVNALNTPGFVTHFDPSWSVDWDVPLIELDVAANLPQFVDVDRNGDVTIVGTLSVPTGSSAAPTEGQLLVQRYTANGVMRFARRESVADFSNIDPIAPRIDDFGRMWVTYGQFSAIGGSTFTGITMRWTPQSHSFCHGDGTASACPCSNWSGPLAQSGCANSTGSAARLSDAGIASVSTDTLAFTCAGTDANAIGLLVEATGTTSGVPFGDGLRCVAGSFSRLYVQPAVSGVHTFPAAGNPSILARSNALGGTIAAGSRRVYQVYYRDSSATFCPSPAGGSFNFSNATMISWAP